MNIYGVFKELGYTTVPESFYQKISEWQAWYNGDVKSFHRYTVNTGKNRVKCSRFGLGMGKKLSEDWANLLMNERVKITIEGEKEQAFVDAVLASNNFPVKINEMQEMKSALGTAAYIVRVVGQQVDALGNLIPGQGSILIDYCTALSIWPLSWSSGIISECAFGCEVNRNNETYLYLQIHRQVDGLYDIENYLYKNNNDSLQRVDLNAIDGFEHIPPVVHTGSEKRQFVIDRLNIANNYDYTLPLGVSVYANAIDVLKGTDIAYDSYVNEFVLGKKRIMVKPQVATYLDDAPAFDPNDVVFYVLPEDTTNNTLIEQIDMSIRADEHNAGLQDQLNLLSSKCGFGENHYRFDRGSISTATQIISENSTLFRTIKKHEIILRDVLDELCRIIIRLGNMALQAGLNEDAEISIDFDDSIIEDKETDFNRDMRLLQAGIMNDWEFRMKWMNEDEQTAKKLLPKMEDLTDPQQDEVE